MTTLQIADTHNLVAFLTKSAESEGFEQIVDFMNASSIKYALTINPTIYTSCIEQFWSTVKEKTVNGEVQLQALVDGKKIVVTEASVRRDLQLEDAEGVDCLPNAIIFEQLTLMGAKTTAWNEFSSTMASAIICLATNQKFNFSEIYIAPSHTKKVFANMKRQGKDFSGRVTPLIQWPRKPKRKDTEIPQSSVPVENVADEAVYEERDDSLEMATAIATGLDAKQDRGNISKTQSKATPNEPSSIGTTSGSGPRRQDTMGDTIAQTMSENVSKFSNDPLLAGLNTPRGGEDSLQLKELIEFARIDSLDDEASLGDQEDASKQGRKIHDIDADEDITLENVHDTDMFGVHDLDGDEVFVETEEPVLNAVTTTSTIPVSAAKVLSDVNMTLAQALAKLKSAKPNAVTAATITKTDVTRPKAKGLVIQEQEQASIPITSSKDKEAIRLQAQFDEEERIAREKEEDNVALIAQWNDIQDKVETDYELAQRPQVEEQEELTIEEKSKLFQQLLKKKRKHFAAKRAEERRNRPPTKAQQRSIMCTYLKNMAGWKPKYLKTKSFANVQELFNKAMKRVNIFVDMDTKLVGGSEVREEGSETREESSSKRAGDELEQEPSKKQKMDDDKETEELSIADGNSQMYLTFGKMLKNFDREDLEVLWSIVKEKFKKIEPVNYMDILLHLNLKTMFEHHLEDNIWKNQQGLVKVLNWKLYDSCGVHYVTLQNILYYLLVEKIYPLTKHTLDKMFNDVKLQVDYECELAFELHILVKK
ncbi:hypothetical protein Tco_0032615 [Tanacetum coccineum]